MVRFSRCRRCPAVGQQRLNPRNPDSRGIPPRRFFPAAFDNRPPIQPNVTTVTIGRVILRLTGAWVCVSALAGCGGEYILTVGDQVATAGGEANVIIRLEKYEFVSYRTPAEGQPMRFQVADLLECCAYTDELGFTGSSILTERGYAGTAVPVPKKEGKYVLKVSLQDDRGREAYAEVPVYVWLRGSPVTAVDLDSLPVAEDPAAAEAKSALAAIAKISHVVYLTQTDVGDKPPVRAKLTACGYPDGPVLTWRRSYLHYFARTGPLRLPQHIRESRLVMHLEPLRTILVGLKVGVCTTQSAAREFAKAEIRPVLVGTAAEGLAVTRRADWADLARRGTGK